jgi:hypothetical protein
MQAQLNPDDTSSMQESCASLLHNERYWLSLSRLQEQTATVLAAHFSGKPVLGGSKLARAGLECIEGALSRAPAGVATSRLPAVGLRLLFRCRPEVAASRCSGCASSESGGSKRRSEASVTRSRLGDAENVCSKDRLASGGATARSSALSAPA